MKKVLALILALLAALCVFSACGEDKKKIDDNDAVRALACEYIDCLFSGYEAALDYVVKDSENYKKTQEAIEKVSSFKTFAQDNNVSENYVADLNQKIDNFHNQIIRMNDCHVTETLLENGKATVTVNVKTPKLGEIENIVKKIKESGRVEAMLTEEERAEYNKSGFSIRYVELFLEEVQKELSLEKETIPVVLNMEKINGDWKIVKIAGELL